jgi:hypothetical protein
MLHVTFTKREEEKKNDHQYLGKRCFCHLDIY